MRALLLLLLVSLSVSGGETPAIVRGVTISCQTSGPEWGTDGFGVELEELAELGANWVAIHPYGRIRGDGEVRWRAYDPELPPLHLARPIREAHARGMQILIKPHLGYWGSPFSWRGDIDFEDPDRLARFFATYEAWIVALARATRGADAFVVGTELDRLAKHEQEWRRIIAAVRRESDAKLTYAANWSDYERIPFWDVLDAVGVQAYFPVAAGPDPDEEALRDGWRPILERLRRVSLSTGKPVVFTELGYDACFLAASEPWKGCGRRRHATEEELALQARCLRVALEVLDREREWLRGAFLWKWFVGPAPGEDFVLDSPSVRRVLGGAWR